jgi:trimeric autotransporter adhesin
MIIGDSELLGKDTASHVQTWVRALIAIMLLVLSPMLFAQLSGVKTIDHTLPTAGNNYASLTEAVLALNAVGVGASGVTFNVTAGQTFMENVPELTATGTSGGGIVFQKYGVGANPVVQPLLPGTLASSTNLNANGDAVIVIVGGDYITFDAIDLRENLAFTGNGCTEYGYYLKKASVTDACKNVTIRNCTIMLNKATVYSFGIYVSNNVGTSTNVAVTSSGGSSDNIAIYGNTISNVYCGIVVTGYNHAVAPYNFLDQGNSIGVGGGNSITNFGGGTSSTYGIYTSNQNNFQIVGNTVISGSGSTSYVTGITAGGGRNATLTVSDNVVTLTNDGTGRDMNSPSSVPNAATYGITCSAGTPVTNNSVTITNNTVTGCAAPNVRGSNPFSGISQSGSAINLTITGNSVSNNNWGQSSTWSSGCTNYGSWLGISANGTSTVSGSRYIISGNTVSNNNRFLTTFAWDDASFTGISCNTSSPDLTVENNTVTSNYVPAPEGRTQFLRVSSNAATIGVISGNILSGTFSQAYTTCDGLYVSGGTMLVKANRISNLGTNGWDAIVNGIRINSGNFFTIVNNFVSDLRSIGEGQTWNVNGISIGNPIACNVYHNTIYLDTPIGNSVSSAGISSGSTTLLDLRNNILVNLNVPRSTGMAVAFRLESATLTNYSALSNNNCFFAGYPGPQRLLYYDGTNSAQTISELKTFTSPRESASFREMPPFVSALSNDLHLQIAISTQCESGGTAAGVAVDYDGDARHATTPDVGADEFSGTPPANQSYVSSFASQFMEPVYLNTVNNPVIGIQIDMDGTVNPLHVTGFELSTNGTTNTLDIMNARLYSTGSSAVFSTTNQFGSTVPLPSGTVSFTGSKLLEAGPNYFWLTYDITSAATDQNLVDAEFLGVTIGATYTPSVTAPAGERKIIGPIDGVRTVGSGGDFPTLTDAFYLINNAGLKGNLVLNIISDIVETDTAQLNQWTEYLGSNYQLLIQPDGGAWTVSGDINGGLVRLNGADRVTIDGLNADGNALSFLNNSVLSYNAALWISSLGNGLGAVNNTIRNCTFACGANAISNTFGISVGSSIGGNGADNDNLTIQNNVILRSHIGIHAVGTSGNSAGGLDNLLIDGNIIGPEYDGPDSIRWMGIRIGGAVNPVVTSNTIRNIHSRLSNPTGIMLNANTSGAFVHQNSIRNIYSIGNWIGVNSVSGIKLNGTQLNPVVTANIISSIHSTTPLYNAGARGVIITTGNTATNLLLANNSITDISCPMDATNPYWPAGIAVEGTSNTMRIYNNSVNLFGNYPGFPANATAGASAGLLIATTSATPNIDVRDNTFRNSYDNSTSNGDIAYAIYATKTATTFTACDYNNYYTPGSNGILGFLSSNRNSLASWQAATGKDQFSMSTDPQYYSNFNLQPLCSSPLLQSGCPLAGITDDALGIARSTTVPTVGAYETFLDTTPPVLVVAANPIRLWPPNHQYQTLAMSQFITAVSDECDANPIVRIISVTSDEEEDANGNGDGDTHDDMVIGTGCESVDLRVERAGSGTGRVYTVRMRATDASGNWSDWDYEVHVPVSVKSVVYGETPVYTELSPCTSPKEAVTIRRPTGPWVLSNYPNPFNPSTILEFTLPEAAHVSLSVYDALGREVAVLEDAPLPAGTHHRSWTADARSTSELYMARLIISVNGKTYVSNRRMLFMK